jgi:hypothetical protein
MVMLVIFTLGYVVGGLSALVLLGLTLAGRNSERRARRGMVGHDA